MMLPRVTANRSHERFKMSNDPSDSHKLSLRAIRSMA